MLPRSKRPMVSAESAGLWLRRNHSTSIGAPITTGRKPAASRTVEWRPSAPTTRSARISSALPSIVARTPTTRPPSSIRPVASAFIRAVKRRIALALRRQEIEEVPLRHHGDVGRAHRQVREVGHQHALLAELAGEARDLLVRQLQELVEQAELVHHVQGRGMDGVAAEVAQEVAVLLQHHGLHTGARQQEAQHHARRAAAHDAALGRDQSSISRSTRPVAVIASNAGTPSGPLIHSLVVGV